MLIRREEKPWLRKKEPRGKLEVFRNKEGDSSSDTERNNREGKVSKMLGDSSREKLKNKEGQQ